VLGAKFDGPRGQLHLAVYAGLTHSVYVIIQTVLALPVIGQALLEDLLHFIPAYEFFPHNPLVVRIYSSLFGFLAESLVHRRQDGRVFATRLVRIHVYMCRHVGDVELESEGVVFSDGMMRGVEIYGYRNHLIYHPS
jgi:hypothetical protein